MFQDLAARCQDPDIEKSNASHKYFIDALTKAFNVLGGDEWLSCQKAESDEEEEDVEKVVFANKFSALRLGDAAASDEEEEMEEIGPTPAPQRRKQAKPGRGKKGKAGNKSQKKRMPAAAKEKSLEELPLESYRIIEDGDLVTEYLMAVYELARECATIRSYLKRLWHEVAYSGLDSAVAGAVLDLAVAMIKRSEAATFVEFPGNDSYETVMKTITRGDPDKAQGMFRVALHCTGNGLSETVKESAIDIWEQLKIYAYKASSTSSLISRKHAAGSRLNPCLLRSTTGSSISTCNEQMTKAGSNGVEHTR